MNGFLQELAKKVAERWVSLLLLPGALFLAVAWTGVHLTHSSAFDPAVLQRATTDVATTLASLPAATQAIFVAAVLLGSTGLSLAVHAFDGLTRGIWLGTWPWPLTPVRHKMAEARRNRWHRLVAARRELEQQFPRESRVPAEQRTIDEAAARVNRMAMAEPGRPTWMGDRVHAVEQIAHDRHGIDLTFVWPRLWLVLPDTARAEITTANTAFVGAVAIGTWAWPYFALATIWWPAILIATAVAATGWTRARTSITDLTNLVEATLDVYARTLATTLGVGEGLATGPLTLTEGQQLTTLIRRGR